MSKRVKWRDLGEYEFLLPPNDQQAKLAELLWAMDAVIKKELEVLERLNKDLDSVIEDEIHGIELKGKGIPKSEVVELGLASVRYGELYTKHFRVIRKLHSNISPESASNSFRLKKNDVLFAGSGETITEIGKSASFIDDFEAYAGSDILIFRPSDMNGIYIGYLMNSQLVRQQLNKYETGATVMHIYNSDLAKLKIPFLDKKEQDKIAFKLENLSNNIFNLESKISSSKALQKSLINQVF